METLVHACAAQELLDSKHRRAVHWKNQKWNMEWWEKQHQSS